MTLSKFDLRYWHKGKHVFHPVSVRDGQRYTSPNFMAAFSHKGHRESLSLDTPNKAAAAAKAVAAFTFLKANGWESWREKYKPKAVVTAEPIEVAVATIDEYLAAAAPWIVADPKTIEQYKYCLCRVAAQIAHITDRSTIARREKIGKLPLDIFTAAAVNKWANDYIKAARSPIAKLKAGTSVNTIIRQCKALFSKDVRDQIEGVIMPAAVPFADFKPKDSTNPKYVRPLAFNISALANAARQELPLPQYKIFTLALIFGLRRREIDSLQWSALDLDAGILRIAVTDEAQLKSVSSAADLPMPDHARSLFRDWQSRSTSRFVIESLLEPKTNSHWYRMRCACHFDQLNRWLRAHGVTSSKPLHMLRKEYGSLLCDQYGIAVAKVALRHARIETTSAHYTADKSMPLPNADLLLGGEPANVISMA
jgi:integrase